jgi:hypothetical protein
MKTGQSIRRMTTWIDWTSKSDTSHAAHGGVVDLADYAMIIRPTIGWKVDA